MSAAAATGGARAAKVPAGTTGLVVCYGVLGFGYILPATFLPVLARSVVEDPRLFGLAWPVFGVMADKDVAAIFTRMAPLVDAWHFTDLPAPRAARADDLAAQFAGLAPKGPGPVTLHRHRDPSQALAAALGAADPADRIVVFGSFYTVGGVMQDGVPRLTGKHTA